MKATLTLAILLFAAGIPAAMAQNEFAAVNIGSDPELNIKDQQILELKAEIAALKAEIATIRGESSNSEDRLTEAVPIIPAPEKSIDVSANTYTVQPGDGLMKIARKTKCKATDIAAANNIAIDAIIHPGQVLKLPAAATVAALNTSEAPELSGQATGTTRSKTYTVQQGETYYRISRRLNIPLEELMAANPKAPANRLYTGRVINLPEKGAVPAPTQTVTEEPAAPEVAAASTNTPPASNDAPANTDERPTEDPDKKIMAVSVEEEISYGDFAAKHGTDIERLNSLNDLNLTSATILAKGSELYVPTQVSSGN